MDKPVFDKLLDRMVMHQHSSAVPGTNLIKTTTHTQGGGGSSSGSTLSYSPATKVVALEGSTERADYFVNSGNASSQIQAAIDAVNLLGGGSILNKAGRYILTVGLNPCSNLLFIGEGDATIFQVGDNCNILGAIKPSSVSNVHLSNFQMDGNKVNNPHQIGHLIRFDNVTNLFMDHLIIHDSGLHGIIGKENDADVSTPINFNIYVSDCYLFDNGYNANGSGLYFNGSKGVTVNNIISTGNQLDGIQWKTSDDIVVNNVVCHDNGRFGIYAIDGFAAVSNFSAYSNGTIGFSIENGLVVNTTVNASNGKCYLNGQDGIRITQSDYCHFSNVKSYNNGQGGSICAGLRIRASNVGRTCDYHTFTGCSFHDDQAVPTQAYGIWGVGSGTVNNNIFIGNQIFGNSITNVRRDTWGASNIEFNRQSSGTTSADGLIIGGDVTWYRNAANLWKTDDGIIITVPAGTNVDAITVNQNDSTSSPNPRMGIWTNSGSNDGLRIVQNGILIPGRSAFRVTSDAAQSSNSSWLVDFVQDSALATQRVLRVYNDGFGDSLFIDNNNNGLSLSIDQDANSDSTVTSLKVDIVNIGNGGAIGIDIASVIGLNNNIGLRIPAPIGGPVNYALQLSDTSGISAGGIWWGSDTNLYRSAANTLKTDDRLLIQDSNLTGNSLEIDRDGATDVGDITGVKIDVDNVGYVGGAIGVDIANITGGGANVGMRIAAPSGGGSNHALELPDTGGTADGGITLGADTNLYRSAANALKTDDKLIVAGESNPLGDINHDGSNLGFYGVAPTPRSSAYTPTNVTPDRSYDANSTSIDEIADILGTLIADLQLTGIIG